ncbi:MAG TPA: GNAT family N-acetyltransferase [Actinomycetota bacterium]
MAATDRALVTRVLRGRDLLDRLGPALDDLLAAVDAPVTARRPWLQTWIECYTDLEPWGVAIESQGGRLEAAALFAERTRQGKVEIVGLGHGPCDQLRLPTRSEEAGEALATAVADELARRRGRWTLRFEQLLVDDPVAAGVVRRVRRGTLVPGDGSPVLAFDKGRDFKSYVGHNSRGVAKTMRNRVKRAGMELAIESLRDPARVADALPEVEAVHRDRDLQLVRKSDLDDPRMERFWRAVIVQHAERGEVELVSLRLSGKLAGYVVGLLDGRSYRLWDGRFAPEFSWYSPGRLADQSALLSALEDERFEEFDWMRGEEEYKLRNCSHVQPAQHLLAWSSWWVRVLVEGPRKTKASLKRFRDRSKVLQRLWLKVKARLVVRDRRK